MAKQCGNRNDVNQKRLNITRSVKSACVEFVVWVCCYCDETWCIEIELYDELVIRTSSCDTYPSFCNGGKRIGAPNTTRTGTFDGTNGRFHNPFVLRIE